MKFVLFVSLVLLSLLFVTGCAVFNSDSEYPHFTDTGASSDDSSELDDDSDTRNAQSDVSSDFSLDSLPVCTQNSECSGGAVCIENKCVKLADVAKLTGSCDTLCTATNVVLTTNNDERYEIVTGKGGYTGAGALVWKTERTQHCKNQPVVPVLVTMMNYGKEVGSYYIILSEGDTSEALEHPNIPTIKFQLTAEKIISDCPE